MKDIPEYLKEGLIEFNQNMYPDSKLTALHVGLKNYYETYSEGSENFYRYLEVTPAKVILSHVRGHSYLMNYYSSIMFFHLSFEQFISEILATMSPVLSRLMLTKELDLINVLCGNIESISIAEKNNIDYNHALKRIEELIKNRASLPDKYKIDTKYDFLLDGVKTLRVLASLRNDIIHSGKEILNRYFYECFFVNDVLPLTRKYLHTQAPATLIERNLACEKNVIDEISRFPLPKEYNDKSKFNTLEKNLRRINHFKELGRASYKNPMHMFEHLKTEEQRIMMDEMVNKRKREDANLHVQFRQEVLGHYDVYKCPCCGTNSLTTYEFWTAVVDNKTRVHTAECAICTYKVHLNIGEPKEFGIMDKEMFVYVD